jgi:hypothetical protein
MDFLLFFVIVGFGAAMMGDSSIPMDDTETVFSETIVEPPAETDLAVAPSIDTSMFVAEDQTPTGKFTTAGEIQMILPAMKAQWVAVRPYEGQDLLYFTNLLAWRCGLHQITYSINGGPMEVLEMEPCYEDEAAPGALKMETILPYITLPLDSVQSVQVHILMDDMSEDIGDYERASIQIN